MRSHEIATLDHVVQWVDDSNLSDPHGFKAEFRKIVTEAKRLQ